MTTSALANAMLIHALVSVMAGYGGTEARDPGIMMLPSGFVSRCEHLAWMWGPSASIRVSGFQSQFHF